MNLDINSPYKFQCIDDIVFIAGKNQKVFKSTNLGDNWETINTPIDAWNHVRGVYFYNESIGFLGGVTNIYKTVDGGLNWDTTDFPFISLDLFHFYNENEGFNIETVSAYEGGDVPTFKGSIGYQTLNGGKSWEKSDLNESLHLGLTYFPNRNLGYGINSSGFYTIKKKD